MRALINDLDLFVIDANGSVHHGNGQLQWDEAHGAHAAIDTMNNAEQVEL
jgi:hypothetical protein